MDYLCVCECVCTHMCVVWRRVYTQTSVRGGNTLYKNCAGSGARNVINLDYVCVCGCVLQREYMRVYKQMCPRTTE
jgi:hypothetical protein